MATRSTLNIAGEPVGVYDYELCELDFYLFAEGDRLLDEAAEGGEDWDDDDGEAGCELGFGTTVVAARGNLDRRGATHERLGQLESLLSRPGTLDAYFWTADLARYAPWTGPSEWFACRKPRCSRGSFPGEYLDLDRFSQDVAAATQLDAADVQRGCRLFYYRFLLERADRREDVRLDTLEVLAASSETRSEFAAPPLEDELGAFVRAVHQWVDGRPQTQLVERRVPSAPLVERLLAKLGDGAPKELVKVIQADPDPEIRKLTTR
ncbi:MAG: hypothetical protein JWM80_1908 [Cyanobacteria bacterium RYN_339]|nr:hypothetical protein [Cyanobacteria bacterium RYN_339]